MTTIEERQRRRRLELADVIEQLEPQQFDMLYWARTLDPERPNVALRAAQHIGGVLDFLESVPDDDDCGTACCAAGWFVQLYPELELDSTDDIAQMLGVERDLFYLDDWWKIGLARADDHVEQVVDYLRNK